MLLDKGADINSKNSNNQTPLYLASSNETEDSENLEIVELLIEHGADVDIWDIDGLTPVMIAAEKGHMYVVQCLVKNGARLDIQDKDDHNLFHICAAFGKPEIIKIVIETNPEAVNLLQTNDQYDNTPLHLAAEKGQVSVVQLFLDEQYVPDIDNKNEDERAPCHLAAKNGHTEILKLILHADPNAIFDKDEDDNTPLHLAASRKHSEAVEFLLMQGASVLKRNSKSWTALDCAAAAGSYECAVLLLNYDSPVDPRDRCNITPLHLSAIHGHPRVTKLLLDHDACLIEENDEGMNALELAISHQKKNVVETILASPNWGVAMKSTNVVHTRQGEPIPNTPMRMLIRSYPELAEQVFDKCIKQSENNVKMNFEFLEDTFSLNQKTTSSGKIVFYHDDLEEREKMCSYDGSLTLSMLNHPLMIMVEERHKQLLKHPLCLGLMRRKWKMIGRYVFYAQLLIYILFMASVTAFTLYKLNSKTFPDENNHFQFYAECGQTDDSVEHFLQVLVIFLTAINIIIEMSQFHRMKQRYFSLSNLADWVIYIVAIGFVLNFCIPYETEGCKGQRCWQWPVGSFLITATWLNLLTYFQHMPFFGIYILMFVDIVKSASKFALILLVFILAFGLGFHIIFINHLAFDTPAWAILKTYVMMIGEFEFEGIFTEHDDPEKNVDENAEMARNIPFPNYSSLLFIVFVFVMSIIISNLLVGLAVDDIQEIQDHAELEKLSMQVRLILETERFLPHIKCCLTSNFLYRYMKPEEIFQNVSLTCLNLRDILAKERIIHQLTERQMVLDTDNDMDKIKMKQKDIEQQLSVLVNNMKDISEENHKILNLLRKKM